MLLLAPARRMVRPVDELQRIFLAVDARRAMETSPPSSRDYYDLVHVNCGFFLDVMSFVKKKRMFSYILILVLASI
jgi:hypothetical protein